MKYIVSIFLSLVLFSAKAQFPGTDSLRNYNNKYITNNPATAFTNLRLNTLLRGIIDWVDTARAGTGGGGALGIDTLWALNDSTIRYRKNGVFRNAIIKGVYDTRRKVDSMYRVNDTTIGFKINGTVRTIIIPGRIALNISNAALTANGDYTQNWAQYILKFDTTRYVEFNSYRPDPGIPAGNIFTSKFYLDSTVNGRPYSFRWALRDGANSGDSIRGVFETNESTTSILNSGDNGNQFGNWQFIGNSNDPKLTGVLSGGSKSSSYSFGHVATLNPNDSVRVKLETVSSSVYLTGARAESSGLWTPVAVLASAIDVEWVSVTDYGAKANDTLVDYTTNIQAALNSGARTVQVPAGVYIITSTLLINSNQTLLAYGAKFKRMANTDAVMINNSAGSVGGYGANSDISIIGLTIDGNASVYTSNCTLVAFAHATGITIRDCNLSNTPTWHLLEINGCKNTLVENSTFHDCVLPDREFIQTDLMFSSGAFPWFGPYDSTAVDGLTVRNCVFKNGNNGIGQHSVRDPNPMRNILIEGCYFDNLTETAIRPYNYFNCTIRNNTIINCLHGIRDYTSYNNPLKLNRGYIIDGNTIFNLMRSSTEGRAINLRFAQNVRVINNTIDSIRKHGIGIDWCDTFTVRNNMIRRFAHNVSSADGFGIAIWGSRNGNVIGNFIQCDSSQYYRDPLVCTTPGSVLIQKPKNITIADNNIRWTPNLALGFITPFGQSRLFHAENLIIRENIVNDTLVPRKVSIITNYTSVATDRIISANTAGGAILVTLLTENINAGITVIKAAGSNTLTVAASSGTINGASSIIVDSLLTFKSDGYNFYTLSTEGAGGGGGGGTSIGGTITSGTTGSVLFVDPTATIAQDNANFFFNNTSNFLGLGNNSPLDRLHVTGNIRFDNGSQSSTIINRAGFMDIQQNDANSYNIMELIPKQASTNSYFITSNDPANILTSPGSRIFFGQDADGTNRISYEAGNFGLFSGTHPGTERFRITSDGEGRFGSMADAGNYTLQNTGGLYQKGLWDFSNKENDAIQSTRKTSISFNGGNSFSSALALYAAMRNAADNADSLQLGYNISGRVSKIFAFDAARTITSTVGTSVSTTWQASLSCVNGRSKVTGVNADSSTLIIQAADSILIRNAQPMVHADSVLVTATPNSGGYAKVGKMVNPKKYVALLNQTGTGDPVPTFFGDNGIGTIVWTRSSPGIFVGTLSGAFPSAKTHILTGQQNDGSNSCAIYARRIDANSIEVGFFSTGAGTDGLTDLPIEIRVYP